MPLGRFSPATDGPGPVGLSGQSLVVPGRTALGVDPYRPPRTRMGDRVPHRLMTPADVALAPGAPLGGDGVDDLAVVKASPAQWKCASRSPGGRTCPVFCVSVLQVGVDSVGVGGGGAGPGPLYLVGGDLSFDGSGLGLALGWWQSFVFVAFLGSFVHGCRRSPAFASSGHRLIGGEVAAVPW